MGRVHVAGRCAVAGLLALVAVLAGRPVNANPLRAPQVVFNGSALDSALTALGNVTNVLTDQVDAQVFTASGLICSANGDFFLVLSRTCGVELGLYDARDGDPPTRDALFPPSAGPGWLCYVHFTAGGGMQARLFDGNLAYVGLTSYAGIGPGTLGLYVAGPHGVWYSQDFRNGGEPHVLDYAGNSLNTGDAFVCLEPDRFDPVRPGEFASVIAVMTIAGECLHTATHGSTWGRLKAIYR